MTQCMLCVTNVDPHYMWIWINRRHHRALYRNLLLSTFLLKNWPYLLLYNNIRLSSIGDTMLSEDFDARINEQRTMFDTSKGMYGEVTAELEWSIFCLLSWSKIIQTHYSTQVESLIVLEDKIDSAEGIAISGLAHHTIIFTRL